jgi:hypothetical protein
VDLRQADGPQPTDVALTVVLEVEGAGGAVQQGGSFPAELRYRQGTATLNGLELQKVGGRGMRPQRVHGRGGKRGTLAVPATVLQRLLSSAELQSRAGGPCAGPLPQAVLGTDRRGLRKVDGATLVLVVARHAKVSGLALPEHRHAFGAARHSVRSTIPCNPPFVQLWLLHWWPTVCVPEAPTARPVAPHAHRNPTFVVFGPHATPQAQLRQAVAAGKVADGVFVKLHPHEYRLNRWGPGRASG